MALYRLIGELPLSLGTLFLPFSVKGMMVPSGVRKDCKRFAWGKFSLLLLCSISTVSYYDKKKKKERKRKEKPEHLLQGENI